MMIRLSIRFVVTTTGFYFLCRQKVDKNLSGFNKTAKNFLENAALVKLLATLVNRRIIFFVAASELGEAKQ
jgi:hypothetical protein